MPVFSQETFSSITEEKSFTNKEIEAEQSHNGEIISWRECLKALTWNVVFTHAALGQPNDRRLKSSANRSSGTNLIGTVPVSARFLVYTKKYILLSRRIRQWVRSGFHWDLDEICNLLVYMQRKVVIPYRRFGTTYRSLIQGSRFLDGCSGDRWVVPKRQYGIFTLRCVIAQKSADLNLRSSSNFWPLCGW
jgi:hypothetical protein